MQFRTYYNSNRPTANSHKPIAIFRKAFASAALIFSTLLPFNASAVQVYRSQGNAIEGVNTIRNADGSVIFEFTGKEGELVKFHFSKEEFAELVRKQPNKAEFDTYLKAKLDEAEARLAALRKEAEKAQPPPDQEREQPPVPPPPSPQALARQVPPPAPPVEAPSPPAPQPTPAPPQAPVPREPAPQPEPAATPQPQVAALVPRAREPSQTLREPGEFSFVGNAYGKLRTARNAEDIQSAFRITNEDVRDDAIAMLTPAERGRIVAFLTPQEQKQFGISSIAGPLLSMPTVFAFKTGGNEDIMGFTIASVVKVAVPEDVIRAKDYKRMRELIREGLKRAISEEQAQIPADKRASDDQINGLVDSVMSNIDDRTLESANNGILKQLQKDEHATKSSQHWTIEFNYPPDSETKHSLTITFEEIRGKSKSDVAKVFEAKVDEALKSSISDAAERKKAVRKVARDLNSTVDNLHARAVKLNRELK